MKLETENGNSFSLEVTGYEFPNEELGPTEDNPADDFDSSLFLMVSVAFSTPDSSWRASSPLMRTDELERLADWLESIMRHQPLGMGGYFTERDLEFSIDQGQTALLVHAFWQFRPAWCQESEGITIAFPLEQLDLAAAVKSLRSQQARFPGRPPVQSA